MAARFVDVSELQIEQFKKNAVPQKTKDATEFGVKLFKGRLVNYGKIFLSRNIYFQIGKFVYIFRHKESATFDF